jgi:hypothetical protein
MAGRVGSGARRCRALSRGAVNNRPAASNASAHSTKVSKHVLAPVWVSAKAGRAQVPHPRESYESTPTRTSAKGRAFPYPRFGVDRFAPPVRRESRGPDRLRRNGPAGTHASFYRTSAGAEIDLILDLPKGRRWAIEIKRGLTAKPEKGFYIACEDLQPARRFVVYAGDARFPASAGVEATGVRDLAQTLAKAA